MGTTDPIAQVGCGGCAVILAGGQSSRMGREKALLEAGGKTLLQRLARTLESRFDPIYVSVRFSGPSVELSEALRALTDAIDCELSIVPDLREDEGPLAGVEAALARLAAGGSTLQEPSRAFFIPVDVPAVSADLLGALWKEASREGRSGCVPRWSRGLEPTYAVYSTELLSEVRRRLDSGSAAIRDLAELSRVHVLDLEDAATARKVFGVATPDLAEIFRNLNRPEDYERWAKE